MATKKVEKKNEATQAVIEETVSTHADKAVSEVPVSKQLVPSQIDQDQYVTVRNGFQGKLVYRSKRTGELIVWEEFGDEQDMELFELKNAKNSAKKYFLNNWFMFDEPWIVDYLGVGRFYRFAISIDEFDSIFDKPVDEVREIIGNLSDGQKRSLSYRARQLIAEKEIDSIKMIDMLEECLKTNLIER